MSREKQIEEMAKVIEITEQIARDAHCGYPSPRMIASDLYDKGYREQAEVARKILWEIGREFGGAYFYKGYTIERYIAELKKKYIGE